ncbi:MAG: hypothetical protein NC397_02285 [Clostridium sp.]|nr:hypothetical protein [Clostridium sp.]
MIINNLVETHCHILPAIDDGSPDLETSIRMVHKLSAQGAKAIILTPHYYSNSISYNDFISKRNKAFEQLKNALGDDAPKLIPAAEVYISKYLFSNDNLDDICIGNTRYALIEHSFSSDFSQDVYDRLQNLKYDYGITPILAHIERYNALMEDSDLLDDYIASGCMTQVNISSFADASRGIRKRLIKYLESGRIHLIGSDCHNLTSRPPKYEEGVKVILKKCGQKALDVLEQNANMLIR